jgi:FSR family fosmidomycin resistance protein-like MFS transporter
VLPLLFLLGAALGLLNPVCVALGNKLDPHNPGMVSAFLMGTVWCVSEVIGPAGGGLLTKLFTEDAPANALALLSIMMGAGLLLSLMLPKAAEEKSRLEYA